MTQAADLYQVLMVDRAVDGDILEAVYRRLVARYQPGAGGGAWAAGRLAAVERAYAILRDPYVRARYDARMAEDARLADHQDPAREEAVTAPSPQALPTAPAVQPATVRVVAERHPVGSPGLPVLDFGRYAGWTLRQLAFHDPDYLEWLVRSPGGRQYRAQITAILGTR